MGDVSLLRIADQAISDVLRCEKKVSRDLRTDHAGETGAVYIYKGILAVSNDGALQRFAAAHLTAEKAHLEAIERVLPLHRRSKLLPCWRAAGWLIGALPSLFGAVAVYNTIDAVESFVDKHYQEQIDYLERTSQSEALLTLLKTCQADEISHRNEARHLASGPRRRPELLVTALWTWVVGAGSKAAVSVARVI